jgi:single-strand DNA-binding protein
MSNVASFTGRIGRDAEVKYLPSGVAVMNVAVANNVGFGDKQQTIWFSCNLWGKRAEGELVNYLKKGVQVFVSGEMTLREYQAKDGTMKTNVEINVNVLDLLSKREDQAQQPTTQPIQQSATTRQAPPPANDFDDIPF